MGSVLRRCVDVSLVDTEEPVSEETHRYVEWLGMDLGPLEGLRDPVVRSEVISTFTTFGLAILFAILAGRTSTLEATLVASATAGVFVVYSIKWIDETLCVLRAEYECDECETESERWEATE